MLEISRFLLSVHEKYTRDTYVSGLFFFFKISVIFIKKLRQNTLCTRTPKKLQINEIVISCSNSFESESIIRHIYRNEKFNSEHGTDYVVYWMQKL